MYWNSCAIAVLLTATLPGAPDPAELPVPVSNVLAESATALLPLSAVWTERAQMPAESAKLLGAEYSFPTKRSPRAMYHRVTLMSTPGKLYTLKESGPGPQKHGEEYAFDGQIYYRGGRSAGTPLHVLITDPKDLARREPSGDSFGAFACDYFDMSGYRFPRTIAELLAYRQPQSSVLFLLGRKGRLTSLGQGSVGAADCDLLEIHDDEEETLHRFFLDPKLNFAVRRHEERDDRGQLEIEVDCASFEQLPGTAVWLPKRCTARYYTWEDFPVQTFPVLVRELELERAEKVEIAESRFVLNYDTTPGATIFNAVWPEAKKAPSGQISYVVPASPQQLDEVIRRAKTAGRGIGPLALGLMGLNVIALTLVLSRLGVRWRAWRLAGPGRV